MPGAGTGTPAGTGNGKQGARSAPRPPEYRQPAGDKVAKVVDTLLDPALEPIVEFVITTDDGAYDVRAIDGRVRFTRSADGTGWRFTETEVEGRNPLADTASHRFAPLDIERQTPWPTRTQQSYPHAHEQIAQLFDHPSAPDVACLHTAAHNWEAQGGERGEHGNLGVVQVRAPFVLAGAGVKASGMMPRSCRLVDVAPTVLALLGASPEGGAGPNSEHDEDAFMSRQDGRALTELFDDRERPPDHVVGFLWDGCNANVLYDLIARGEVPNLARLLDMGVAFGHGAMASWPSVTLANHTTVVTGTHPGQHGILNNAWYDRRSGAQVITNSPETWPWAMQWMTPGIETIHQAVHRYWPDSFTASVNEMCDVGADYSTFELLRTGRDGEITRPPRVEELPFATERFVRPEKSYQLFSRIDHTSMTQAIDIWAAAAREGPIPRFCFVNFSLTDTAFHHSGPYADIARSGIHDTDLRMGQVLDAIERSGVWDRTAFFLVADHGMEDSNPEVTGDWGTALATTGISLRDEAYGFIYIDP